MTIGNQPSQNYDIPLFLKKCIASFLFQLVRPLCDWKIMSSCSLGVMNNNQNVVLSRSSVSSLEDLEVLNTYFIQQK